MEEEDEVFDLGTLSEYEVLSNDDGSVLIEDQCVVIKHNETKIMKMLPLTEEVLQALGLALVLDEEQAPADTSAQEEKSLLLEVTETELKQPDDSTNDLKMLSFDDGNQESEVDYFQLRDSIRIEDGGITIDKDILTWTTPMVNRLLDLYEANQDRFFTSASRHKILWQKIHKQLSKEFPELENCGPTHMQSKLGGLKRTYRGAVEYLQDNLHTTKWPFFERMDRIMKFAESMKSKNNIKSGGEVTDSSDPETSRYKVSWRRSWSVLLLECYLSARGRRHTGSFWADLRDVMLQRDSSFEPVTTRQLYHKFNALKQSFINNKDNPTGELSDKRIYDRLSRVVQSPEPQVARVQQNGGAQKVLAESWPASHTNLFLELFAQNKRRLSDNTATPAQVYSEISDHMNKSFPGACVSAAVCVRQKTALKKTLKDVMAQAPADRTWPFLQKALRAFGQPSDPWPRDQLPVLLQYYARVNRVLDESGPRFWDELARKYREVTGLSVTASQCENKMQSLFLKYKMSITSSEPVRWTLFNTMHQIFGNKPTPWPNKTLQAFLTVYQKNINKLEASTDQDAIWESISDTVNTTVKCEEAVSAAACRDKMLELKMKYTRLMRDQEAAKAWPLYKRMSELFSCHLWSKSNVQLLLDIYQESGSAMAAPGGWARLTDLFNRRSVSSAVITDQCQTEMHVLRARYKSLLNNSSAATAWPFFEKMHEIFKDEPHASPPRTSLEDEYLGDHLGEDGDGGTESAEEYVVPSKRRKDSSKEKDMVIWSEEHMMALLESYAAAGEDWEGVALGARRALPDFHWAPADCQLAVRNLQDSFHNMNRFGDQLEQHLRLSDDIYQKLKEIFSDTDNELTINGDLHDTQDTQDTQDTIPAVLLNGNTEILQTLLEEIKKKNFIMEQKNELLEKQIQEKRTQHQEVMELLRKIQETLNDGGAEERSDAIKLLEKNLEEIHKSNEGENEAPGGEEDVTQLVGQT